MANLQFETNGWWAQTSVQAGDTVLNTTAETVFASKPTVFPANSFNPGDTIRFCARGLFGAAGLSICAYTFRVRIGSVVLASTGSVNTALGLSNKPWHLEGMATFNTVGSTGVVECGGSAVLSLGTGIQAVELMPVGGVTVDTTVDMQFQLSSQASISLLGNVVTMRQLVVEKIKIGV